MIGCFYIFYTVSIQHLVGTFGSGVQRTRNFSIFSLGVALSAMFGPTLAGFSIDLAGHKLTYLFLALIPAAPAAFLIFFAGGLPHAEAANRQAQKPMMDLVRNVPLRRALVTAGIIETGLELFNFYMPIYGHSLGLSASLIGIIMGAFATAMLVMRGRDADAGEEKQRRGSAVRFARSCRRRVRAVPVLYQRLSADRNFVRPWPRSRLRQPAVADHNL